MSNICFLQNCSDICTLEESPHINNNSLIYNYIKIFNNLFSLLIIINYVMPKFLLKLSKLIYLFSLNLINYQYK
jgi:hypothetical protein